MAVVRTGGMILTCLSKEHEARSISEELQDMVEQLEDRFWNDFALYPKLLHNFK